MLNRMECGAECRVPSCMVTMDNGDDDVLVTGETHTHKKQCIRNTKIRFYRAVYLFSSFLPMLKTKGQKERKKQ